MATKKGLRAAATIERVTPVAPAVALALGFLLLAIVGVVTVVVPEVTDDGASEDGASEDGETAASAGEPDRPAALPAAPAAP
jgi:hypothetical protein